MLRKIKAKDIVTVTAIAGLGYLLLTRGSPGPTGGGGSGGGKKKEGITGVIADELGGLGITTPNYTINLPGHGGDTFVYPDFPGEGGSQFIGPDYSDPGHKYKVPFEWPKLPKIENIDILNELIGVDSKKARERVQLGIIGSIKTGSLIAPTSGIMQFLSVIVPKIPDKVQGTGQILTKKGRAGRVKTFRKKYKIPESYSYPVTHKGIKAS